MMRHLTEKMRKRDIAANAVLTAGLIGNLQSPQHFVRSGHIEGPGVQLMQRMMKKRKEADRNLDSGVVSQGAKNRTNVSAPSARKRMAAAYDRMKKQKREKADEIIRDLRKEQKTFQDFMLECYELEESSGDERGRRRLSPRGPSANRSDRNRQRQDNSNRAALSKAGFRRSPRLPTGKGGRRTKWTETSASTHHDTETGTYANQSDYAAREIGNLGPKGNKPTIERALKALQIRKQFGGDRTSRPVHDVAVNMKRTYNDDDSSTMTKGRSFRQEVTKGVEKNLEKAGAKPGDIRTSTPTSDSRSRMYGRTHGLKTSKRTGITVDRIQDRNEEFMLECYELEESSTDERMGRGISNLTQFGNLKIKGQARSPENTTTRRRRSVAAIAKKAGLKGTGKLSHHDLRSSPRDYDTYDSDDDLDDIGSTKQDHFIRTYKSPRRAASGEQLISKYRGGKVNPSKDSVRKVRDFKKSMTKAGADERGRVHSVNIMHRDSEVFKGDKYKQMERGRNFIKAVKDTPEHLKKAGAKKGEAVVGKPYAVMSGEDSKTGKEKRAKLYKKIFKGKSTKKSEKTGMMVGKAD